MNATFGNKRGSYYTEKPCFGRLRELRGKSTADEIADIIGCSRQTYRKYEDFDSGSSVPYYVLQALADHYNVSIDYLTGRSNFKTPGAEYIGKKTGLSDSSIEKLQELQRNNSITAYLDIINAILEDSLGLSILAIIARHISQLKSKSVSWNGDYRIDIDGYPAFIPKRDLLSSIMQMQYPLWIKNIAESYYLKHDESPNEKNRSFALHMEKIREKLRKKTESKKITPEQYINAVMEEERKYIDSH